MCDFLTALSAAASLGSAAIGASQAADLASKQEAANADWMAYQRKVRADEDTRQEDMRKKAEAARQGQVDTLGVKNQQDMQTAEAARLAGNFNNGPTSFDSGTIGDKLLSGQKLAGNDYRQSVADRVSQASAEARKRITALANVQSYGNSFGGLGTVNRENFANSDNAIGLQSNMRGGSLKTYGVEQSVEPVRYYAGQNTAGAVAGVLGSIAGNRIGTKLGAA